jgi:hypothetical protein
MDMFIHENFFGNPYQVAFVVDPKIDAEGLFIRRDEKIVMMERFWVKKDEHKCVQTKNEKEALFDRFDKLEKKIKEISDAIPAIEESRGGGMSFFSMMGWMFAIIMLIFLLLQNIGPFSKKGVIASIENPIRNNEVLIYSEDDAKRGVTVRVYAAPMIDGNVILPRHAIKGDMNDVKTTPEPRSTAMPGILPSPDNAPPMPSGSPGAIRLPDAMGTPGTTDAPGLPGVNATGAPKTSTTPGASGLLTPRSVKGDPSSPGAEGKPTTQGAEGLPSSASLPSHSKSEATTTLPRVNLNTESKPKFTLPQEPEFTKEPAGSPKPVEKGK